jgi:hypothetical protein
VTDNGPRELGKNALIASLRLIHGADTIAPHEVGNAGKQYDKNHAACPKRSVRPLHHRLTEGTHAVADRLHPGHRDAAGGESAQKQPDADRPRRLGQTGRRNDRLGLPACREGLVRADCEYQDKARGEEVSGQRPRAPRIYGAPQVHDGNHHQNYEAQRQRIGVKRWNRGRKCPTPADIPTATVST